MFTKTKPDQELYAQAVILPEFIGQCIKEFDSREEKTMSGSLLSDLMDYDTTLSVTEIGKKLSSKATVKSKIYAAQTFVNNFKLERDILSIYKNLGLFFGLMQKRLLF